MEKANKINCVIVDDELLALERMEYLLNFFDNVNVLAKENSAEQAIEKIVELKPGMVFLDIEMSIKNGFEMVEEIRKRNVYPTFVFVTAYNQYAIKAIKTAAFDFLVKPVDIDELAETLNRYVKRKSEQIREKLPAFLKKKYLLTDREIEIVQLIAQGKTSREIADELFISKLTVDTHRKNILEKTGEKNFVLLLQKVNSALN